jgi:hypothetical protein
VLLGQGCLYVWFLMFQPRIGTIAATALLAIFVLHELGHLLTAQWLGMPKVWLRFVPGAGGVLQSLKPYDSTRQEAWVALGGSLTGFLTTAGLHYLAVDTGDWMLWSIVRWSYYWHLLNLMPVGVPEDVRVMTLLGRWLWLPCVIGGVLVFEQSQLKFTDDFGLWVVPLFAVYRGGLSFLRWRVGSSETPQPLSVVKRPAMQAVVLLVTVGCLVGTMLSMRTADALRMEALDEMAIRMIALMSADAPAEESSEIEPVKTPSVPPQISHSRATMEPESYDSDSKGAQRGPDAGRVLEESPIED